MYWLVSLPLVQGSKEATWRELDVATGAGSLSHNYRFELPSDLRVGSLDALLTLSDDLMRVNAIVEGVVNKIRRQITEVSSEDSDVLTINQRPVQSFLTSFTWDEAKFTSRKPLKDIVDDMAELVQGIDDDLKMKVQEYSGLKQYFSAVVRKTTGSLAIKDLSLVVDPSDIISTENLTTIIVTVPGYNFKDFMSSYETFAKFVVPRSAKVVAQDNDYSLVRVILFHRVLDDFKLGCRTKGCQTREYKAADAAENGQSGNTSDNKEMMRLEEELDTKRHELEAWCRTSYAEAFSAWIHICAVRLFTESVLRYGLPPSFQACIVRPNNRSEEMTRKALFKHFGSHGSHFWKDDGNASTALEGEIYPYVSFTLDIEDE